jgi:hypothetical protein
MCSFRAGPTSVVVSYKNRANLFPKAGINYAPGRASKGFFMPDIPRITVVELDRRMRAGEEFTIIDVRNPTAWAESDSKASHAIRVPLEDFERHLPQIPKDRPLVTYCT